MKRALALLLCAAAGCSGTTGSGLVAFTARVGGPADVTAGAPLEFDSGNGYHISLIAAKLHLGAVFLNESVPSSGGPEEPCVLPGIYVGEAFGGCDGSGVCGVDVDLLSPALTTLPIPGQGTVNPAYVADVWLTSGDVNASTDTTPVLVTNGTATKNGMSWPFSATVTVGPNRMLPVPNPAVPGSNPICRQRIVSPICLDEPTRNCQQPGFTLQNGGTLDVRVDARSMFDGVDFAALTAQPDGSYVIPDAQGGVGGAFFMGVKSTAPYHFSFSAGQ